MNVGIGYVDSGVAIEIALLELLKLREVKVIQDKIVFIVGQNIGLFDFEQIAFVRLLSPV